MSDNTLSLKLTEIADWHLKTRDQVSKNACWAAMPSFQRGLVWSPAQIEVLWDSLMRGIPIGALSLLPIDGTERFRKSASDTDLSGAYWIVDGQQRSSAIALGFDSFPSSNKPILWLDMCPDRSKRTRRKYFFYVTTPGRPWGYGITNGKEEKNCEQVPVDQYRRVLREELRWGSLGSKPETYMMWPVKANLPVPFCELRKIIPACCGECDLDIFTRGDEAWRGHYKRILEIQAQNHSFAAQVRKELKFVSEGIRIVEKTSTIGLIAQGGLLGDEEEVTEADENSNIAVYFARLNQGGTPPQREDIDYSILKSVVPELSVLDQYAEGLMHPSRMANIAMLTYLTKEKWKSGVSRSEIYRLQNDLEFRCFIVPKSSAEDAAFKLAMETVSRWLCYQGDEDLGLPKVVCSSITKSAPSLYRLLLLLAAKANEMGWEVDRSMMVAFITLISWFGKQAELDYALVFDGLRHWNSPSTLEKLLRDWVVSQIEAGALMVPPRLKDFENIRDAATMGDSKAIEKVRDPVGYGEGLNCIWNWKSGQGREFLLYACRKYLAKTFKDYDPASAIWNEDSRPWDYDHIFPQDWLQRGRGNKKGPFHRVVEEFMMSIGNVAPVPFSLNRSWHSDPPKGYLEADNDLVHVQFDSYSGDSPMFVHEKPNRLLENAQELACEFAYLTASRWVRLYKEWIRLPVERFLSGPVDDRRKKCIEIVEGYFRSRNMDLRIVYLWPDGRQYDVVDPVDWARPWISCGVCGYYQVDAKRVGRCMACITINGSYCEVGLRKHPDETGFNGTDDHWVEGYPRQVAIKTDEDVDNAVKQLERVVDSINFEYVCG